MIKKSRVLKSIGVALYSLFILNILMVEMLPPVEGHQLDLFSGYIIIEWSLIFIILSSALATTFSLFYNTKLRLKFAFSLLLALSIVHFFSVPLIRGYYLFGSGRADVFAHLGMVNDIRMDGEVGPTNWYPITHILIFTWSLFGVETNIATQFYQPFLFIYYMLSIGILTRRITKNNSGLWWGFLASSPLLYSHYYLSVGPSIHSFWLVPTFLYLLFINYNRAKYLLIILSFLFVFYHPATTVLICIILISMSVSNLYGEFDKSKSVSILSIVLGLSLYTWINSIPERGGSVFENLLAFVGVLEGRDSVGGTTASSATDMGVLFIIRRLIEIYGPFALIAGAALIMSMVVIWKILSNSSDCVRQGQRDFVIQYYLSIILGVVLLFGPPLLGLNFIRQLRYAFLMSVIVLGLGIVILNTKQLFSDERFTQILSLCAIGCILISLGISAAVVYDGSNNFSEQEYSGAAWMAGHHNMEDEINSYTISEKVFMAELGMREYNLRYQQARDITVHEFDTPLFDLLTRSGTYTFTTEREMEYHKSYHPSQQEQQMLYDRADIGNAETLHKTNKLYQNPEINVWKAK